MHPGSKLLGFRLLPCLLALLIAGALSGAFPCMPTRASAPSGAPRVVLLISDALTTEDVFSSRDQFVVKMLNRAAIGLMNTRTAGSTSPENCYLTIGAGARARSDETGYLGFDIDSNYKGAPVTVTYEAVTGGNPSGGPAVLSLGIERARELTKSTFTGAEPGALGKSLEQAGHTIAVIGNGDTADSLRRQVALVGMNAEGLIPAGTVEKTVLKTGAEGWPFGIMTDYSKLLSLARSYMDRASVIVLELGDSSRLEASSRLMSKSSLARLRAAALQSGLEVAGELLESGASLVMLVSPTPSEKASRAGRTLTPILMWGPDVEPGILTSRSTRQNGLVANVDIAPTILTHLGISRPPSMTGSPIRSLGRFGNDPEILLSLESKLLSPHLIRPAVVKGYIMILIGVYALFLIMALKSWYRGAPGNAVDFGSPARMENPIPELRKSRLWIATVSLISAFPLASLLSGALPGAATWQTFWIFLLTALTGLTTVLWRDKLLGLIWLWAITAIMLVADISLNLNLMRKSVLGYDSIGGARFYGIGNEYMGILIGSVLVVAARMTGNPVAAGLYAYLLLPAAVIFIGSPLLGANLGGALASTATFGSFAFLGNRGARRRLVALAVVFLAVGVIGVLMFLDSRAPETASHSGQVISSVRQMGFSPIYNAAVRKLTTNLRLIRYTIWTQVFLASLGVVIYATFFRKSRSGFSSGQYGRILKSALIGSLAAFVANDSGVVAAATLLLPVATLFLMGMGVEGLDSS